MVVVHAGTGGYRSVRDAGLARALTGQPTGPGMLPA